MRIRVKAFGVNESEVTSRKGLSSPDFTMPRVLGIECVGVVDEAPRALSDEWVIPATSVRFGVRLTTYGGEAADLPVDVFSRQLQAIADGRLKVSVAKV